MKLLTLLLVHVLVEDGELVLSDNGFDESAAWDWFDQIFKRVS